MPDVTPNTPTTQAPLPPSESTGDAFAFDEYLLDEVIGSKPADAPQTTQETKAPQTEQPNETPAPAETETKDEPPAETVEAKESDATTQGAEQSKTKLPDDLSAEAKQLLSQLPKKRHDEVIELIRQAQLSQAYLDANKPAAELAADLKARSAVRYGELQSAIITEAVKAPDQFCAQLTASDPNLYGQLIKHAFQADPQFFIQALTGKQDVTPEQIARALDFYAETKGGTVAGIGNTPAAGASRKLTDEQLAELDEYFPECAPTIRALNEQGDTMARVKELQDKVKEFEAQATGQKPADTAAQTKVFDEIFQSCVDEVESYVDAKYTKQYQLGVTDAERKQAPMVATAKDLKRAILLGGSPVLGIPGFEQGFTGWAKDRPGFEDALKAVHKYARAGEKENAQGTTRKLNPLVDTYAEERLKIPIVALLDQLIDLAVKFHTAPPAGETHIPGQSGPQTRTGTSSDYLLDAVLSVAR